MKIKKRHLKLPKFLITCKDIKDRFIQTIRAARVTEQFKKRNRLGWNLDVGGSRCRRLASTVSHGDRHSMVDSVDLAVNFETRAQSRRVASPELHRKQREKLFVARLFSARPITAVFSLETT